MKKNKILVLIFIICTLFSGCNDSVEVDSRAYPVAMAIGTGTKEKLEVALQFSGKTNKGKEDAKNQNTVITAEGDNVFEAYEKIDEILGKKLSPSQLNALIISDDVAQSGITDIIFELVNAHRGFKNMFVVLSSGSAIDYLDKQQIWLENSPSKFYSMFLEKSMKTYYSTMKISEIAFNMLSNNEEIVLPYISFVKSKTDTSGEDVAKSDENKAKFQADNVETVSPQKSELNKMGVFKGGKLIGELEDEDIVAYGLLKGEYSDGYLNIPMGNDGYVNLTIKNNKRTKVKVKLDGNIPRIDVSFDVRVIHIDSATRGDYDKNTEKINDKTRAYVEKICRGLLYKTMNKFDTDIFGYGCYARRNFLYEQDFRDYMWAEKYKNSKFNVEVIIKNYNNHIPYEV